MIETRTCSQEFYNPSKTIELVEKGQERLGGKACGSRDPIPYLLLASMGNCTHMHLHPPNIYTCATSKMKINLELKKLATQTQNNSTNKWTNKGSRQYPQ